MCTTSTTHKSQLPFHKTPLTGETVSKLLFEKYQKLCLKRQPKYDKACQTGSYKRLFLIDFFKKIRCILSGCFALLQAIVIEKTFFRKNKKAPPLSQLF